MILGVGQLVVSSGSIDEGVALLCEAGYSLRFITPESPNASAKKGYVREFSPGHVLASCYRQDCMSLELINHGSQPVGTPSSMQTLWNCAPPGAEASGSVNGLDDHAAAIAEALSLGELPVAHRWGPFDTTIWVRTTRGSNPPSVAAAILPVSDPVNASRVWVEAMDFRIHSRGEGSLPRWVRLGLATRVKAWSLDIILMRTSSTPVYFLDAPGFGCVTLLTTSVDRSLEAASRAGALHVAEPFEYHNSQQRLRIGLVRGAGNEIIELIQFGAGMKE